MLLCSSGWCNSLDSDCLWISEEPGTFSLKNKFLVSAGRIIAHSGSSKRLTFQVSSVSLSLSFRVKWPRRPVCQPVNTSQPPSCSFCSTRRSDRFQWELYTSSILTSRSARVSLAFKFDIFVWCYAVNSDSTNTDGKKHNCVKTNFKPQSYMLLKPVSQAHC